MRRQTIIWLLCLLAVPFILGTKQAAAQSEKLEVIGIYWSPAGDKLVILIVDREIYENYIQIVDVQGQQVISTLYYPATSVAWSPDGQRIAVNAGLKLPEEDDSFYYSDHLFVTILDAQTGQEICQIKPDRFKGAYFGVGDIAWSPDGRKLAVSTGWYAGNDTYGGDVQLWNVPLCVRRAILLENSYWTVDSGWWSSPVWDRDSRKLVFSSGRDLQIWDVEKLERLASISSFESGGGPTVWNEAGSRLAIGNGESIRIIDTATGSTIATFSDYSYRDLDWTSDNQLIVVAMGKIVLVDPMTKNNTGRARVVLPDNARPFLSPDHQQVAFFDGHDIQIKPLIYVQE